MWLVLLHVLCQKGSRSFDPLLVVLSFLTQLSLNVSLLVGPDLDLPGAVMGTGLVLTLEFFLGLVDLSSEFGLGLFLVALLVVGGLMSVRTGA